MSATDDGSERAALAPITMMVTTLSQAALAELENALSQRLYPKPTASDRRLEELGYLASLLEEVRPSPTHARPAKTVGRGRRSGSERRVPRLRREIYEARQPQEAPDAPTAKALVGIYGSWITVCQRAYGLKPDGRYVGSASPWAQPLAGKTRPRYTLDDTRTAIRRCANELGRIPSAGDYHQWSRDAKRLARERGVTRSGANPSGQPLVPGIKVIYRLFQEKGAEENRWRAALADVGLTEVEVARARERALHIDDEPTKETASTRAIKAMTLSEAVARAHESGVSLDYLVGRSLSPGVPPDPGAVFDPAKLASARAKRNIAEAHLRTSIKMQLGPWRRLMKAQIEPTLGQLTTLAAAVGFDADAFVTE